jgi:hypothetical protein
MAVVGLCEGVVRTVEAAATRKGCGSPTSHRTTERASGQSLGRSKQRVKVRQQNQATQKKYRAATGGCGQPRVGSEQQTAKPSNMSKSQFFEFSACCRDGSIGIMIRRQVGQGIQLQSMERTDYVGVDGECHLGVCQFRHGATSRSKRPGHPYLEGHESREDYPRQSEGSLDPSLIGKETNQCHVGSSEELVSKKE